MIFDQVLCDNDIWCGNSRDLNVAEHIGTIIKSEVEKKCYQKLDIIENMETDTELFETLLCSYPSQFCTVKNTEDRDADY